MGTQISRGRGKLYRIDSKQFVDTVKYQIHEDLMEEPAYWWGEFTFVSVMNIREDGRYIIELEDGRNGQVYLKKLVNRPVSGVPPTMYTALLVTARWSSTS